jgi:exosortase
MSIAELPQPVETLQPVQPPSRTSIAESAPSAWKQALPALIVLAAYVPMLVMHGINLWSKPHYQFFPLVLGGAVLLGFFSVRRQGRFHPGRYQSVALIFGFLSLCGLAASAFLLSSLVAIVSFLVGLLAFIYSFGGWRLTKKLLPAWIFLWLMVPPPFNWDQDFITWLKFVTAGWTSYVLDVFGILHVMRGNVVIVPPYQQLLVEEACSGIHSFFAIITCALFLSFWSARSILHTILLVAGGVGFVLTANVARVTLIAVAQVRFNVDLAHGLRHDVLGFVIFFALCLLTLSLDRLLCFLFNSTYSFMALFAKGRMVLNKMIDAKKKKVDLGPTRWPGFSTTWVYAKPIVALALLLCLANYSLAAIGLIEVARPSDSALVNALNTLGETSMPLHVDSGGRNPWDRFLFNVPAERARDDKLGQYSRIWKYRMEGMDEPVDFSVDYTFYNWHDLTVCYRMNGWIMVDSKEYRQPLPGGGEDVYVEAQFRMPEDGRQGYLLFSLVDELGRVQPPAPHESLINNRIRRLKEALERRPTEIRFQLQAFATSYNVMNTPERDLIKQFFLKSRQAAINGYLAARQGGK